MLQGREQCRMDGDCGAWWAHLLTGRLWIQGCFVKLVVNTRDLRLSSSKMHIKCPLASRGTEATNANQAKEDVGRRDSEVLAVVIPRRVTIWWCACGVDAYAR
jgi:hypothetical protein